MSVYGKQPHHRDVTCVLIRLAKDEWGNETMKAAVAEAMRAGYDADCYEVWEHGGWWLTWDRTGRIVSTANDSWPGDDYARRFWKDVWAKNFIATINRNERTAPEWKTIRPCAGQACPELEFA